MNNNEKKDTYDKLFGSDGTIFSESGFDEMQKARNYEIGFRIFRVFFWAAYFMAAAVMVMAMFAESKLIMAVGAAFVAVCDIFYLLYAAKVSSLGAMNLSFAKRMSQQSILIAYIFIGVIWTINAFLNAVVRSSAIVIILTSVLYIGLHICAKRNMKVLEKMLKDESEEE